MTRSPGPHPLPIFLATLQAACADDPARLATALAGLARYQQAPRPAPPPKRPEIARIGEVSLRGTPGPRPVVIVPSLINPAHVLDLPGRSLMAHLESAGLNPLIIDWGDSPEPLGLASLANERLAPLVEKLGQPVAMLGYCLGGTLALAVAAHIPVTRLALIATPWHFAGYGGGQRAGLAEWWASAQPLAQTMGQLPIDLLQPAFWSLDPAGLVAKYVRLATANADDLADFVRLEDWANGGAPLSLAAVQDLAEQRLTEIAQGTALALGARAEVSYKRGYPVTVNATTQTGYAVDVARAISPQVDTNIAPMMGAEDFSYMLNARPGAYIFVGNGDTAMVHHPAYNFDDNVIPFGASWYAGMVEARMPV